MGDRRNGRSRHRGGRKRRLANGSAGTTSILREWVQTRRNAIDEIVNDIVQSVDVACIRHRHSRWKVDRDRSAAHGHRVSSDFAERPGTQRNEEPLLKGLPRGSLTGSRPRGAPSRLALAVPPATRLISSSTVRPRSHRAGDPHTRDRVWSVAASVAAADAASTFGRTSPCQPGSSKRGAAFESRRARQLASRVGFPYGAPKSASLRANGVAPL
jgi:hypothetical protein